MKRLLAHPDFSLANPNRLRSLVGAFAANQRAFHDRSGEAIASSPISILAVDKLNPQNAARLVPPLGRWRRFDEDRGADDAGRAGADPGDAGASQGRVRAGLEESGLRRPARKALQPYDAEQPRPADRWAKPSLIDVTALP